MKSMTARVFVDSNVLIYARDVIEVEKQQRADLWLQHLWDAETGRLSYQVLAESYSVLMAKRMLHSAQARAYLKDFLTWRPLALDGTVLLAAWSAQDRFGLSWWDCLIVAAARIAECDYLLTEDLQHDQDLDGLRVINPFVVEPGADR
jgi:predicted nucleic acid-binding protein